MARPSWLDLERSAPEVAAAARRLFDQFGFVLMGTIRRDGTPRISPVEVHLVNGHLMIVMVPRSQKAGDLQRDPRVVLQTPVTAADDPGDELKIRGRVAGVEEALRGATADAVAAASGWRPELSWDFRSVLIDSAAHLSWQAGDMVLTRWDPEHGMRGPQRRRLDFNAGAYLRAPE